MGIDRVEFEKKLLSAKSRSEITDILKAAGQEISEEETASLYRKVQELRGVEGRELSLDELDAVSGGVTNRNWQRDGCAATVEEGSNCWGTDGGCTYVNIHYSGVDEGDRCKVRTTHPCVYEDLGSEDLPTFVPQDLLDRGYTPTMIPTTYKRCIYCGRTRTIYTLDR